ncbi:nucleotidyltransferase family protein [Candidatus Saccharibacteria bacterium]|nr:nucleotidyltransferase family protein [Candidatus Saccharibacteria bacterium]
MDEIKTAVTKAGKKYGIKNAYLFGSYARGEATEDSDVDIIIDRGEVKTYNQYADLHYELENDLGEVDLLSTDGIHPRFYELIKNDRIPLYGA